MPSTELVTFNDSRKAWNTIHGTELPSHNGLLSAEQAAEINRKYDIEIYVGTHGKGFVPELGDTDSSAIPSELEYNQVASVVDTMQPGDTLFIEGKNFRGNRPNFYAQMRSEAEKLGPESTAAIEKIMLRQIQEDREKGRLDAFEYADLLAQAKGIRVIRADYDAFDVEAAKAVSDHILDPSDRGKPRSDFALATHTRREYAARNIVKDAALDELSQNPNPEEDHAAGSRKSKLVVLWGGGHKEDLERGFADSHLNAKMTVMEQTPLEEHPELAQIEKEIAEIEKELARLRAMGGLASSASGIKH